MIRTLSINGDRDLWLFVGLAFLTSVAAFALSFALVALVDLGALGGSAWLRETHVRYFVMSRLFEYPVAIFVHAVMFEFSFLGVLVLALWLIPKNLLENHVFAFVFLSFLLCEIGTLGFFPIWWANVGFLDSTNAISWFLFALPLPGAVNYAVRLLSAAAVARCRKVTPWKDVPWWSIFAPTVSFAIAALVLLPIHFLVR